MRSLLAALALGGVLCTAGCTVGPRYARPAAPSAPEWKTPAPWQQAAPNDALTRGAWWETFGDAHLNSLEQELLKSNQSLAASRERLEQSRSLARVSTSAMFPQLTADPGGYGQRISANRLTNGSTPPTNPYSQYVVNVPFALSYEADLFGRVRKNVEAANASLQATAADQANVQLVLSAELAADYFTLRELDAELLVVQESVGYQQKGLELVQRRHDGGVASGLEVAQQAALLDATKTQLSLIRQSRAQYEHAIATLVGQPASLFAVAAEPLRSTPPPVPLGVPSEVLERRPDIAFAERQMAFQNAQVGIARSAFYPHITLGAAGGLQSRAFSELMTAPSLIWSLGGDALTPVFSGGKNRATLAAAQSAYKQSVASYRQTVLTSFQQVEDGLSNLNALSSASETQAAAVEEARKQLEIANSRYVGGVTTYLDVITAQSTLLANQRLASQLLGQRMVASVYLVKALGGGWDARQLEKQQVKPEARQVLQP